MILLQADGKYQFQYNVKRFQNEAKLWKKVSKIFENL